MAKSNVDAFVIWEESMPLERLVDFLTINHFAAVVGPLHDRDVYTLEDCKRWRESQELFYGIYISEDAKTYEKPTGEMVQGNYGQMLKETITLPVPQVGDKKKPHRHVYVQLDYSAPLSTWLNLFAPLDIHYMETVKSKRGYLRYLCHLDNPEKARYNTCDVISLGGVDISCIFEKNQRDADDLETLILDSITKYKCHNITQLQNILLHEVHNRDAYREVKAHFGYWRQMMADIFFYDELHVEDMRNTARIVPADADGVVSDDAA